MQPVVADSAAIGRLLETILDRGGLTISEMARRMDVTPQCIRQYIHGRRRNPSLKWFIKLAELAGARVTIEFPK